MGEGRSLGGELGEERYNWVKPCNYNSGIASGLGRLGEGGGDDVCEVCVFGCVCVCVCCVWWGGRKSSLVGDIGLQHK